jgi:hypothetical protein
MPAEEHIQYVPESSAVALRGVAWSAAGALVLLAAVIGSLYAIYQVAVPIKTVPAPQEFSQPRVDTQEVEERHRIMAAQTKKLETWRWVNDQHTLIQIPIERAMQLLVEKGGDGYAPLLPPQPALSSPMAGAQRTITPGVPAEPANPQEKQP